MKKLLAGVTIFAWLLPAILGSGLSWARAPVAESPPGIAGALQPLVDDHVLAGAVTLVASREKVLSLEAVGYADLAAFYRMIAGGGVFGGRRYLSAQAVAQMTSKQTGDLPALYGLGFSVDRGLIGHGGSYNTHSNFDPRRQLITIFLAQQTAWRNEAGRRIPELVRLTAEKLFGDAEPPRVPAAKMVAVLQPFVDQHRLAGAVALVASRDKILCLEAVGYADVEARTPMRTDNMFWIASMTKSMTTTAIMMLVDEGKLKISDPVEKYLPEFQRLLVADPKEPGRLHKPAHPVTVEELLSHTHGLGKVPSSLRSLQDDVVAMAAAPMECEPGTRYKYSSGIDAGGRILEKLSGMRYADFMQTRLFTPLGMRDTTFWPDEKQVARLARTFKQNAAKTGIENVTFHIDRPADSTVPAALLLQYNGGMIPIYKNRYAMPSGGLHSTASDVGRFCQMLLAGGEWQGRRYLSPAAIRQMSAIHSKDLFPAPLEGYGLGWFVERRAAPGHPSVGSYGHRGARKTVMWVDPAKQIAMVLMLQSFDLPGKDQEAIYGAFVSAAEAMSPVK